MKVKNLHEAETLLKKFVPNSKMLGKNMSTEATKKTLSLLGNPQKKFKAIHIAGTSGKTSTSYFISKLLTSTDKKIGLTVSPHIYSLLERIQINNKNISEKKFCNYFNQFYKMAGTERITYFEAMISLTFFIFAKEKVDYAVVETGLGGLFDSTNVLDDENKICVITDIGFDHMKILGNSLSEISFQKAGIIHRHNPVIMYKQKIEIMRQILKKTRIAKSKIYFCTEASEGQLIDNLEKIPLFQRRNWLLAKKVFDFILERDKLKIKNKNIVQKSIYLQVPGRMNVLRISNKIVICDGAHNTQKIHSFVESFIKKYGNVKVPVILAMKDDKEYKPVLKELGLIASRMYLSQFSYLADQKIKSVDITKLKKTTVELLKMKPRLLKEISEILHEIRSSKEKMFIVTGSLYFLSNFLKYIKQN